VRPGVITEPLTDVPLADALDWLAGAAPQLKDLELVSGGYGPIAHCPRGELLRDAEAREAWRAEIESRGFRVCALNAAGNPLHPDTEVARRHDVDLRETILLAAELGIDRVVTMSGLPAASPAGGDVPHFAGGGWMEYLAGIFEWQWEERVVPYWRELCEFAHREHPDLMVCLELHPGTCVYNVETFQRAAAIAPNLGANLDPSHFFWQQMDAFAVIEAIRPRIGHSHAKDVSFNREALAVNGLLDHRWPGEGPEMPWRFSTAGREHGPDWWREFASLLDGSQARVISIEHEDPLEPVRAGLPFSAELLGRAIADAGLTEDG
jgi:sugar phosphate isomerase/epimerase